MNAYSITFKKEKYFIMDKYSHCLLYTSDAADE